MPRPVRIAIALLALAAGDARAQGPGRTEFTLPNGLRVRLAPARGDKEVIVILGVRAGFFAEPAGKPHLAHLAEHLVVFGSKPGSGEAKATDRWFADGRANGETVGPLMYFDLRVPSADLPTALRAQASRLDGPSFTRAALDREVPRTLAEVENLDRSDAGYTGKFAAMAFVQAAFHGQARIAIKAKTRGFTPEDVRDFWTHAASPGRAILCVAGAFDPEAARAAIEAAFGAIPKAADSPSSRPSLKPGRVGATWDLRARHLLIAWPAPPPTDPDHPALTVASLALTQRLFLDPDLKALTKIPTVDSDADGCFLINAYVVPGADVDSLRAKLLDRVGTLSAAAPSELEIASLRMAVGQMLGFVDVGAIPLPEGMSRSLVRANIELQRLMRELNWGDPASYKARVDKVDRQAVIDAARRHLDPAKATIVRLGPGR